MNIVFNVNELGLEGLGATLTSLIRNCSNNKELKLYILCSKLKSKDKNNILQLLEEEDFEGRNEFIDFDAEKTFGHLKSLHGDWTTYGRLLIPEMIKDNTALYLDSDLIVNKDILQLNDFHSEKALAAVFGSTMEWVLEKPFFLQKLQFKKETAYFNAGVLYFNIEKWKEDSLGSKIKEMSARFPNELLSADQTLLNAVCQGEFSYLEEDFNVGWTPNLIKPERIENAIVHFVGAPKPWDIFGKIIHPGFNLWNEYNTSFWRKNYSSLTVDKILRSWRIRRSLIKHLRNRMSNKIKK